LSVMCLVNKDVCIKYVELTSNKHILRTYIWRQLDAYNATSFRRLIDGLMLIKITSIWHLLSTSNWRLFDVKSRRLFNVY